MKNILKIKAILAAGLLLIAASVSAQDSFTVKGTVKDPNGDPIIGAAVMLDGSVSGAVTDVNGNYSITFPINPGDQPRLVFSCFSYKSVTEAVAGRAVIDAVLQEDNEELDEVVVVGYGAMKKSDLTGSVASVKIDDTQAAQSSSVDQLIQGKAAGVQVVSNSASPDAASQITVRGASSFNSNSQPLYVVDGILLNTSNSMTVGSHGGEDAGIDEQTNGLAGINPQDIASIEILKDASATAIYGSQGANGVVIITTKSASKEKPSVYFTAGVSVSTIYKKFDVLDTDEFVRFLDMNGANGTEQWYTPFTEGIASGKYVPVDWQDYTTRASVSQRYYLTVTGRPKRTNYLFSLGYFGNTGIVKGSGFQNPTLRLNLEHGTGRFVFGTKTSLSFLRSEMIQGVGSTISQSPASSLIMSMLMTRPLRYISEYDEEGIEIDDDNAPMSGPDRWLTDYQNLRTEFRVTPSIYMIVDILPWLKFKTTFGADYRTNEQSKFKSRRITPLATGSNGAVAHVDRLNWNWDNLLLADKTFSKHHISGTLGHSSSFTGTKTQSVEGTNVLQWKGMSSTLNTAPYSYIGYGESSNQILSFFARAVYSYDERYVLTATYRFDGSSKFAGSNRWAQFPSFAFAWRINSEPWFHSEVISLAKLRVGWGRVGNQGIPSYQTVSRYNTSIASSHDTPTGQQVTISSFNLPNKDLKWETTSQFNGGIDLGMFNGRFTLTADGYYKRTDDLLQTKILAGSAGVYNPYVNMGAVSNSGFELTLSGVPVLTKSIEWSVDANISLNRNRIVSIDPSGLSRGKIFLHRGDSEPTEVDYFTGSNLSGDAVCRDYVNVFIAGQPMCLFYAMPTDGIVQEGQTGVPFSDGKVRGQGSVNFVDTNKDGVITAEDRVIVGNPNPDFLYGFSTSFRYKEFSLSAQFTGSFGNDIYNQQAAILSDVSTHSNNVLRKSVFDSWSPSNPDGRYPALSAYTPGDINWCTDRYVEDGSYLRLSNLSVSYSLKISDRKSPVRSVTFSATGKNLCVWTKYSGYDPDVNVYGSVLKYGIDSGAYPSARTFMFDVKLAF